MSLFNVNLLYIYIQLSLHWTLTSFSCVRPTLPPAKQANRNLILKAISEAQDSITKTTSFSTSIHVSLVVWRIISASICLSYWPFLLLQYHRDRRSLWLPALAPHTEMRWLRPSSWSRSTSTTWLPRPTLLPHYLRLETLVCAEKIEQILKESHF